MKKQGDLGCYYMTNSQISKELSISAQRVQQIINNALKKLKKLYNNAKN